MEKKLMGVFAPITTPFDEKGDVAYDKLKNGGSETKEFYEAKIKTAEFYFEKLLPRASGHSESMLAPSELMAMDLDSFNFLD